MSLSQRRQGLTLIEILVVVAIVSLLIAVLLPALRGARNQAVRVKCSSNLHQLATAFHMYANDHRGRCMPLAYTTPDVMRDLVPVYWWGADGNDGIDHTRGFTWPYLGSDLREAGVYECPRQPAGSYDPQGATGSISSTYGYNGYYLSPPYATAWSWSIGQRPWPFVERVPRPDRVLAFADSMLDWGDGTLRNSALLDPPWLYSSRGWTRNYSPTTSFRHEGRTVAAFVDGHVDSLVPQGGPVSESGVGAITADNDPFYVPDWRDW
jgi:prepilin-type N-terminal cleavage/methylation domain-containing protein/prepilin-type processing-associated H-X9-DG protein